MFPFYEIPVHVSCPTFCRVDWVQHLILNDCVIYMNIFFFFFLATLGLRCCAWAFSSCGERGLLFVAVCGLIIAVASLVAEHGL